MFVPHRLVRLERGHIVHIPDPDTKVLDLPIQPLLSPPSFPIFRLTEPLICYLQTYEFNGAEIPIIINQPRVPIPLDKPISSRPWVCLSTLDTLLYALAPVRTIEGQRIPSQDDL